MRVYTASLNFWHFVKLGNIHAIVLAITVGLVQQHDSLNFDRQITNSPISPQ